MRHDYRAIRDAFSASRKVGKVAALFGCSVGTVRRAVRSVDQRKTATSSPGGPGLGTHGGRTLAPDHPAAVEVRTLFPTMVRPIGALAVLKSGEHSAKIGGVIHKGKWRDFPVYCVTLEERATCPASCHHWLSCYGNNSPYSLRYQHGAALEDRLRGEVTDLGFLHRNGFAVRLHSLGDFYSVAYVEMWRDLLARVPALHCFGYSARDDRRDPVGVALRNLVDASWPRFGIRFSDGRHAPATVSIKSVADAPRDAVICPAQTGDSESCSTCALCWSTQKRIAFVEH